MDPTDFIGANAVYLILAIFVIVSIMKAVRIVPQSQKFVIERFGRLPNDIIPAMQ